MKPALPFLLVALAVLLTSANCAEVSFDKLLPHPRLLLTAEGQARLEKTAKENKLLTAMLGKLREAAEYTLTVPPATYKLVGPGPRRQLLLHESQAALSRVLINGLAYRLFHDERFAHRALEEMRAVVAFNDWHPVHFLDPAEMCAAVAVGYDWLYPLISEAERVQFRNAIIQKALEPSERFYPAKGWAVAKNNWNQVCNGGLTMGALAIADTDPAVAKKFLSYAIDSAPNGMASYAPDGAYPEGPMYWTYGTVFNCLMLSALDSALGTDFGLSKAPGFDKTGLYMAQMIGPHGDFFNYADCHTDDGNGLSSAPMFWLGREFERPLYSAFRSRELTRTIATLDVTDLKRSNKYFPLDIVWFDASPSEASTTSLPRTALFRGTEAVTLRSSFDDNRAVYVGFKGGSNRANHSHLDLGSFVLDARGVRWALDLGSDDYDLEGYWDTKGGQRWSFYRLNTQSHNTLTIGAANQDPNASAPIIKYSPTAAHAVADLSAAYAGKADRVHRGIELVGGNRVLIQDEIAGLSATEPLRWAMVTAADVTLDGSRAILSQKGEQLIVEVLEPKGATLEVLSTRPPLKEQMSNEGTRMLAFTVPGGTTTNLTLRVLMTPGNKSGSAPVPLPLSEWETIEIPR